MSQNKSTEVDLNVIPKLVLFWYLLVFLSTEILSFLGMLNTPNIIAINLLFIIYVAINYLEPLKAVLNSSKKYLKNYSIVILLLALTFTQGLFSAPNTTDSMTYHIPRVMYWLQEGSSHQNVIRNSHDFIPPFAEYILLHLYVFTNSDRLLFLSQWLAFAMSILLSCLIAKKLGAPANTIKLIALGVSTIPIAVLQASSTQVDMVSAFLVLMSLYIILFLLENLSLKYALYLGISMGLGFLVKPPFIFFVIVPLSLLLLSLKNDPKKTFILGLSAFLLTLLMLSRYFYQNITLYGNILGQNLSGSSNTYVNERFNPAAVLSNLIKNTMNNIPIPVFNSSAYNILYSLHAASGININDPKTNYDKHEFRVSSVIYPQEDIAGSPLHLIIIFISGFLMFKLKNPQKTKLTILYTFLILSYILFALILKWEPYHPRLQIPFMIIGTMIAIIVLSETSKGRLILKIFTKLSVPLSILLILLNTTKPFISYTVFYENVKQFSPQLASIPISFYEKNRTEQYFNSRQYWLVPYDKVISDLALESDRRVRIKLMDEYEYPLWAVAKAKGIQFISLDPSIENPNLVITTGPEPFEDLKYTTKCYKTSISYGYACISKKIAKGIINNI